MVARSWRFHTQRTPAGEKTVSPRFLSSLATRTWPLAGEQDELMLLIYKQARGGPRING
jgi:hypothetical protein